MITQYLIKIRLFGFRFYGLMFMLFVGTHQVLAQTSSIDSRTVEETLCNFSYYGQQTPIDDIRNQVLNARYGNMREVIRYASCISNGDTSLFAAILGSDHVVKVDLLITYLGLDTLEIMNYVNDWGDTAESLSADRLRLAQRGMERMFENNPDIFLNSDIGSEIERDGLREWMNSNRYSDRDFGPEVTNRREFREWRVAQQINDLIHLRACVARGNDETTCQAKVSSMAQSTVSRSDTFRETSTDSTDVSRTPTDINEKLVVEVHLTVSSFFAGGHALLELLRVITEPDREPLAIMEILECPAYSFTSEVFELLNLMILDYNRGHFGNFDIIEITVEIEAEDGLEHDFSLTPSQLVTLKTIIECAEPINDESEITTPLDDSTSEEPSPDFSLSDVPMAADAGDPELTDAIGNQILSNGDSIYDAIDRIVMFLFSEDGRDHLRAFMSELGFNDESISDVILYTDALYIERLKRSPLPEGSEPRESIIERERERLGVPSTGFESIHPFDVAQEVFSQKDLNWPNNILHIIEHLPGRIFREENRKRFLWSLMEDLGYGRVADIEIVGSLDIKIAPIKMLANQNGFVIGYPTTDLLAGQETSLREWTTIERAEEAGLYQMGQVMRTVNLVKCQKHMNMRPTSHTQQHKVSPLTVGF